MEGSRRPEISVIIPVRNGAKTLPLCLDSVFRSEGLAAPPQVMVVDDASEDESAEIASRYPVVLIRLPSPMGGGLTRNPGAERAAAPILFFTDADVELNTDTLALVLKAFDERPGLHGLFGAYSADCPQPGFFSQYKNLHHHFIHRTASGPADTFWTGCGAVRRDAFRAVGGFRGVPHIYDVDFGYRLTRAGYRIEVLPHIQVRHHKRYTFAGLVRSDFLERAVPWSGLLWEHRRLFGRLNTRPTQAVSVALSWLGIASLWFPARVEVRVVTALTCFAGVAFLNRNWAVFCRKERGGWFALGAMAMEGLHFLYSGLGLAAGTLLRGMRVALGRLSPGRAL